VTLTPPPNSLAEIETLRTVNSKTFDMGAGVFTAIHAICPIHWQDIDGTWQEIDTTLDETGSPNSTQYDITISASGIGYSDKISGDSVTVSLTAIGDTPASQFNIGTPAISGNTATWSDVVPGVDIYLEAMPAGARFHAIIKSATAPTSFTVQYTQPASLTSTVVDMTANGTDAAGLTCQVTASESTPTTNADGQTVTSVTYTFSGNVRVVNPTSRNASWQPTPTYPVDIDPTVTAAIAADANDGFEYMYGSKWYSSLSADKFGCNSGTDATYGQNPGWRWALAVPQGATISSATLSIYAVSHSTGFYQHATIYGVAADNAAAWGSSNRPSQQTKTAHNATVIFHNASGAQTVTVTNIVQDVVSRSGWVNGNFISLFGIPTNVEGITNFADYHGYHGTPADLATLSVTYTGGSSGLPFSPMFSSLGDQLTGGLAA
jgi:hypothetical protein